MARYLALLRGVNVGTAKRVPMAEWRALLQSQGCTGVRTLLNSGNAVFDSPARSGAVLARRLHEGILQTLGVNALQGLAPITQRVQPPEQMHVGPHAAYPYCASGILQSQAGAALLGKLGRGITTRNGATVRKIEALMATD